MMAVLRTWATPLTAAAFVIMAVTGVLMFFHLDVGLNKQVHEWLGWLMVVAVLAHGWLHWPSLRRYLTASRSAQATLAVALLVLGASFVVSGEQEGAPPPVLAMQAISRAPLKDVATLAGKPFAQVQHELAAAGLPVRDEAQTLQQLTGGDRSKFGQAMRKLFGAPR